jgi:hypothetical protein
MIWIDCQKKEDSWLYLLSSAVWIRIGFLQFNFNVILRLCKINGYDDNDVAHATGDTGCMVDEHV